MSNPYGLTIGHRVHSPGVVVDGYETGETWATAIPIEGCAVADGRPDEPVEDNRDGVYIEFTIFGPPNWLPNPRDRIVHPKKSGEFEVHGYPKDWSVNPMSGRTGGVEVLCKKFEG